MTKFPQNRNLAAGLLLFSGVGVSAVAARGLERLGQIPKAPGPFYVAFAVTVLLAYFAGRCADIPRQAPESGESPRRLGRRARVTSLALAYVCLLLFLWSWLMRPPLDGAMRIVTVWASSLVAGAAAFAVASSGAPARRVMRRLEWSWPLLLTVLLAAAAARLIGLDRVPPTLGGDEVSQVRDGLELIRGKLQTDPFGTGWTSSMHLGMLPAGWGSTLGRGPIAGPRFPYAAAGTLSVVASAAAAAILAGGWAAPGCAALLAFSPHHVHFSRIASHMILDSFFAGWTVLFLFATYRARRPLWGYLAGLSAGLSLYGYQGGRALALTFLLAIAVVVFRSPASRGDRVLLALAATTGFFLATAPNLRFAFQHFIDWNARFNQVGIFEHGWWNENVRLLGSPGKLLVNQFVAGTIGLLSEHTLWPWYQGYPIVAPILLPSLALTGLGWMVGRGWLFHAALLALVALGNLAAIVLTQAAPAPQRASSLMVILAIFGGVAIAGFLSVVPSRTPGGLPSRGIAGTLLIGGILAWTCRPPGVWDPSPGYGAPQAAFVTSAYELLRTPRYRGVSMFLHGPPNLPSSFPTVGYLLPQIRWTDSETGGDGIVPAGFHLFTPDWLPSAREWKKRLNLRFGVAIADRGDPLRELGYLLYVPHPSAARSARPGP